MNLDSLRLAASLAGYQVTETAPEGDVTAGHCEPWLIAVKGDHELLLEGNWTTNMITVKDLDGRPLLTGAPGAALPLAALH
ncbi:hypothetical protein DES46_102314 [Caldimonas thermodepolymerans]|nr:hypothetical protein DES46_102314 [Caldimonas thermodepolymerans]